MNGSDEDILVDILNEVCEEEQESSDVEEVLWELLQLEDDVDGIDIDDNVEEEQLLKFDKLDDDDLDEHDDFEQQHEERELDDDELLKDDEEENEQELDVDIDDEECDVEDVEDELELEYEKDEENEDVDDDEQLNYFYLSLMMNCSLTCLKSLKMNKCLYKNNFGKMKEKSLKKLIYCI